MSDALQLADAALAGGDVGHLAVAFGRLGAPPSQRPLIRPAGEIARRVAFAAMARPLDEVLPAQHRRRPRRSVDDRRRGRDRQLPQPDAAADVERKGELVRAPSALDRRQRLQEGPQIGDVLVAHARVGRVGKGRDRDAGRPA